MQPNLVDQSSPEAQAQVAMGTSAGGGRRHRSLADVDAQRAAARRRRLLQSYPASLDWSALGKVGPILNQQQCGDCYVFSAVGQIESAVAIASGGPVVPLSEQFVVQCATGLMGIMAGLPPSPRSANEVP